MAHRNPFWRTVARNFQGMEQHAPEGYVARAEVLLQGDPEPLPIGVVHSRAGDPWLLFELPHGDPDLAHPNDRLVFAHESQVARVEIRYVRESERPLGFKVHATEAPMPEDG
jgi:hypothetical protein